MHLELYLSYQIDILIVSTLGGIIFIDLIEQEILASLIAVQLDPLHLLHLSECLTVWVASCQPPQWDERDGREVNGVTSVIPTTGLEGAYISKQPYEG